MELKSINIFLGFKIVSFNNVIFSKPTFFNKLVTLLESIFSFLEKPKPQAFTIGATEQSK